MPALYITLRSTIIPAKLTPNIPSPLVMANSLNSQGVYFLSLVLSASNIVEALLTKSTFLYGVYQFSLPTVSYPPAADAKNL